MEHLGYLGKLKEYTDPASTVLDPNEKEIVSQFNSILSKRASDWVFKHWSLCPLLFSEEFPPEYLGKVISNEHQPEPPLYIDHYTPRNNASSNEPLSANEGFVV